MLVEVKQLDSDNHLTVAAISPAEVVIVEPMGDRCRITLTRGTVWSPEVYDKLVARINEALKRPTLVSIDGRVYTDSSY